MRFKKTRESYIPKGAAKVAARNTDAVAYLWAWGTAEKPKFGLTVFFGKQTKPVIYAAYGKAESRAKAVAAAFANRTARQESMTARRKARTDFVAPYKVGDVFKANWGYDQTNIEYFEIVEIKGKFAIVREIAQEREYTDWAIGRCVPMTGKFIGPALRRRMNDGYIKINSARSAFFFKPTEIVGVKVYNASQFTEYA